MSSVLHSCLEESEEIEQDLLDMLLTPLLPSSKSDNISAYTLVGHVLRSCPVNVQSTISVFLNNVLVGAPTAATTGGGSSRGGNGGGVIGESELSDSIYPLIYELHKVSPELLLKVLPNICVQLQAEDEEIRLKAVKLLGRLFASQYVFCSTSVCSSFFSCL
jgi:sister-chromatid-cohesion protein PDS5